SAKTLPPWRHRQKLHGLVPVVQTYFEISTGIHLCWQTIRQTNAQCGECNSSAAGPAAETLSFETPSCRPGRWERLFRPRVVQRQDQARPRTQAARREPQRACGGIPEQALDAGPHVIRVEVRDQYLARVGDVFRLESGPATARQCHDLPFL